jgi:hypothetical protein
VTAGTRRRPSPRRKPTQPETTTEERMQPQQPPPVPMDDEALKAIWNQHKAALADAAACAQEAAGYEQMAAAKWDSAQQIRQRIAELTGRAEADEDAAQDADKNGKLLRQDEHFHQDKAKQIANAVSFLGSTNNLIHPAERERRDAEIAAANAGPALAATGGDPLPAPQQVDHLAAAGNPDLTKPFPNAAEQM